MAIQFLDCVHQLWSQHTSEFEFSLELLTFLGFHLYSGAFGNLLFKNMRERLDKACSTKSLSVWSYVLANKGRFVNPLYGPNKHSIHAKYREKQLRVWREMFASLDDSLKREQGANNASTLQYPPLARSVDRPNKDLTLEEKLMLEVLRLREENRELKTQLHASVFEAVAGIKPDTWSKFEQVTSRETKELSLSDDEPYEDRKECSYLVNSGPSKAREDSLDSPGMKSHSKKGQK